MPMHLIKKITLFAAVLAVSAGVLSWCAETPTPGPTPQPPTPMPYTAPAAQAVQTGKAPLRVLLVTKKPMLAWKGEGAVRAISLDTGADLYAAKAAEQVGLVRVAQDQTCWLRQNSQNFCAVPAPLRLESDQPIQLWTPSPDNWTTYTGPLILLPAADGTFSIAREMYLEDYVRGVLPGEMPATFHPQALRAQAIIARTYTLCQLGRHAADGADLCATVHCQMLAAEGKRSPATDAAAAETRGRVLLYGEKLAETYYHATCGGTTDDAGEIWGPAYDRPYLHGACDARTATAAPDIRALLANGDAFCKHSNGFRWEKTFTAAEVDALVAKNLAKVTGDAATQITHVTNLAVEERTPGGRVATFRVEGDGASVLVYGDQVRWLFGTGEPGPAGLWSALFNLTPTQDAQGNNTAYTFTGGGRGHGLGLCQWGADGRGKAGQTFREILRAYYPGCRVSDEK